ncbi:ATP-binding cassette domain-containing protein [Micromonosporaceae bacterium B7E4]
MSQPLLATHGLAKRFGRVEVLKSVDLTIGESESVGLIGDNGAGKSTLVKILSGVYAPTSGRIEFQDRDVHFASPQDSRTVGVEIIHQDLALCDDLDATANVFLGRELRRRAGGVRWLDRRSMREAAERIFAELGATISPDQLVGSMSGGERQLVAVARALEFQPKLLLMDEPTAALSNAKIHLLLDMVNRLKARGVSVLLVSHRFTDLLSVCDRIVAMRDGTLTAEIRPDERDIGELMTEMQAALTGEQIGARR